ncbi:mediator of RNA polymerase II transcription subunit 6 [Nematocida displodere]|uniref:Mediator of RNA polymerase II transcription subunit 6 n=1 Tax=Nematocida displodere TaxID=1805483 RepID=A0A177ELB4_9MICR|nr:mediator of RNA polymerase II transcription subunit 6 [Nematocida displodere]OAG32261.1 mediator of RNA polymerase II transcription subunit 6 [Nematocida displodere]
MENTCFRDPLWLQHNALTSETALSYFSLSQFYDRNCNNEVLKMQTMHNPLAGGGEFLQKMAGIQYVIDHAEEPQLFLIKKCERLSPEKVFVLDYYYIIHGTVYQAPTEKEVSRTRYTNILFSMMATLNTLPLEKTPNPSPSGGVAGKRNTSSNRLAGLFNSYYTELGK